MNNELNYANHAGYSDVNPFEIVRRVSEKTLDIRAMSAERDPSWKPEYIPGGFSAHCANQREQRWVINSDPAGRVVRIRKTKRGWRDPSGARYMLADAPVKYYDYNF